MQEYKEIELTNMSMYICDPEQNYFRASGCPEYLLSNADQYHPGFPHESRRSHRKKGSAQSSAGE